MVDAYGFWGCYTCLRKGGMGSHSEALLGPSVGRATVRQKWEGNEGPRPYGGSLGTPGTLGRSGTKKLIGSREVGKWPKNRQKTWIIVHESGRPRGPGTGDHGVPPKVIGGPLKAHLCLGRVIWSRSEALPSLAKIVPSEPREGISGKEMKV